MPEGKSPFQSVRVSASLRLGMRSGVAFPTSPHPWQPCHVTPLPCIVDTILGRLTGKWKLLEKVKHILLRK